MKTDFDANAALARKELPDNLSEWNAEDVSRWFARWYMLAGHKRLGRMLVRAGKAVAAA